MSKTDHASLKFDCTNAKKRLFLLTWSETILCSFPCCANWKQSKITFCLLKCYSNSIKHPYTPMHVHTHTHLASKANHNKIQKTFKNTFLPFLLHTMLDSMPVWSSWNVHSQPKSRHSQLVGLGGVCAHLCVCVCVCLCASIIYMHKLVCFDHVFILCALLCNGLWLYELQSEEMIHIILIITQYYCALTVLWYISNYMVITKLRKQTNFNTLTSSCCSLCEMASWVTSSSSCFSASENQATHPLHLT